MIIRDRLQQRLIQPHKHELRDLIFHRHLVARIAKVEGIVVTLGHGDVDVEVIDQLVGRVIDGVGVPSALGRAGGSFHPGGVAIDGELCLPVEDREHLFHRVVKVFGDTAAGLHLAAEDKIQVNVHSAGGNERLAFSQADTAV